MHRPLIVMAESRFNLTTTAFAEGGAIPKVHTCDGIDTSPPLGWSATPVGTASLALLCDDPDALRGTWVHWVLYDLDPAATDLATGVPATRSLPGGACQGKNDFGNIGYGGPCPPAGHGHHRYYFRLLALDHKLGLSPGATMKQVLAAAEGHVLARAELMGRYERR